MRLRIREVLFGNGAATNSLYLMSVSLVTTLIGIIIAKVLSVNLSLKDYGTYSQVLLLTTTVTSFTALGLSTATNYYYNRTDSFAKKSSYVVTIISTQLLLGIISGVLLICFDFFLANIMSNPALVNIIYIIAFSPLLTNLISIYQVLFVSIGKAKNIAFRNFLVSFAKLCAVLYVCYRNNDISLILFVILSTDLVQILYFNYVYSKTCGPLRIRYLDFRLLKPILCFSIPFAIYTLAGSLANDIDKYIISLFCDIDTIAIYCNAAKRLPFAILTDSFITVLVPIVTRLIGIKKYDDVKNAFKLYLKLGYISTFIIGFGALILSKYLMCFLYDKKYLPGLPVFNIYIAVEMIRFANVTILLTASGKTFILMLNSIIMLVLNVIFDVFTFKVFGIIGPAITTFILSLLSIVILLYFGSREIQCKIKDLFDCRQILFILFEILIVSIPVQLLSEYIEMISDNTSIAFVISFVIYCFILGLLNMRKVFDTIRQLNDYR